MLVITKGIPIPWNICFDDIKRMYVDEGKCVHTIHKIIEDKYDIKLSKSAIHSKLAKEGVKSHRSIRLAKKKLLRCNYEDHKDYIIKMDATKGHGWIAEKIGGRTSGVRRVLKKWADEESNKDS